MITNRPYNSNYINEQIEQRTKVPGDSRKYAEEVYPPIINLTKKDLQTLEWIRPTITNKDFVMLSSDKFYKELSKKSSK